MAPVAYAQQGEESISRLWRKSMPEYSNAPPPLAFDIDVDGQLEIIQVSLRGEVSAIDPDNDGAVIWSTHLGDHQLLSPVAGHFLGNNRISVLIFTADNQCFVLDGPTGRPITERPFFINFPITLPPSVFNWTGGDQSPPEAYREGVLLYNSETERVHAYLVHLTSMQELLSFNTRGPLNAPPAIGRTGLDAPPPHAVFVTTDGYLTVLPLSTQREAVSYRLSNQARTERGVTLADLDGDGTSEIVVPDREGYLHGLRFENNRLRPFWSPPNRDGVREPAERLPILSEPVFPPVAIDVNGDGNEDLLVPRRGGYALYDGPTGEAMWPPEESGLWEYIHGSVIVSPPAVFHTNRGAMALFGDDQGVTMLDIRMRRRVARFDVRRRISATPLVGSLIGDGNVQAFIRTETDAASFMLELPGQWNDEYPPWMGHRGGPNHSLRLDRQYHRFRAAQFVQLSRMFEVTLSEARTLADEGLWREARELIRKNVLSISPTHGEALRLDRQYFLRANRPWIFLGSFVAMIGLGALGWTGWRHGRAALQIWTAQRALKNGQHDRAITCLRRHLQHYPNDRKQAALLARIYIQQKRFDEESAEAYRRAWHFFPREERFLKALATAYSSEPRLDENAAAIYKMMARLSRRPGPWYFILGQALQEIDRPSEALEAYRLAIVHQYDDPRLPTNMADLYIQLGITSPDILPTLDRVIEERRDDPALLRTYCRACQEARRYDDQAQQVAMWLLERDPEAPAGHAILATRLLQSGRHKEAMRHAQQILQVNPSDSVGLRLLGACYAAERRLDETAMKIFAKALEANPDAPEILIAVSHGYVQEERIDPEARDVYLKALAHYPQDETVLAQLARIAEKEQDDELTVQVIEPLLQLGRRSRELVLQLANAYCRLGNTSDGAADIYREALIYQPDHATLQENLAAIYLRHERTDAEALAVFEPVYETYPERFDLGLQLMRCYSACEMPERALALGEKLREQQPDNADLQKLMASVSEKADQMETAIAGYERVLESRPDDPEAVTALSSLYGRKRLSDNRAIEIYLKAIQINPQRIEAYLAAARAYAVRDTWDHVIHIVKTMLTRCPGQVGEAITLLESLADGWPKQLKLRWYLVETLIFNNRLRDAERHIVEILNLDPEQEDTCLRALDKILEKNPKDAVAHLERGRILNRQDRQREARHAFEQAHRYHPENEEICRELVQFYQAQLDRKESSEMRFHLGRLSMRLGKYDLAISCFQTTSRDYRWESESIRYLAHCFMEKGMLDLAMQELKRLQMDNEVKDLLYQLGQRYEAVNDVQGAREAYKLIFAADITYRDVKGKLETLNEHQHDRLGSERTAIIQSLSDEASKRYKLLEELGRGAMGIVYKAHDQELEEVIALKILPDNLIRNPEAVRRFRQEARNARRLAHPNIVRIHDIGEEHGRKYISMEFVEGSDLKRKMRAVNRKLPFADTMKYAMQLCDAMAYAHEIGIVHRDIKPANLMLTRQDQIKVTDFGIAKMVEQTSDPEQTKVGAVVGTPLYMSPEQVKGEAVDHRADIYSMGIVLYEMAGGYPPFTEGDLSYQHLFVEPKPLKNVPKEFAEVVMKCLAKNPDDRWQSVAEMHEALRKVPVGKG